MADETKKPTPSKQWDNPKVLTELCVALYQALEVSGGLTSQMKDAIPAYLEKQEYPITWSAIRRKTMTWDAKVHEDILIEVFQTVNLSPPDVGKLMDSLKAKGYTFSESALRQHIQKLRKTRDTSGITGGAGTPAKTPTKKGEKATPNKKRTASAKKSKATVDDGDDGVDERLNKEFNELFKEEPDESPCKRIKTEAAADGEA